MLTELSVRDLGVIDALTLELGPGMTALTGETGAGKTLLVEALELVVGARADGVLVRPGAEEAEAAARFVVGDGERILARTLPASGRSRAYLDGRMATAAALAEAGAELVDLHGQHTHQSLLGAAVQRAALDAFGEIDLAPLARARDRRRGVDEALEALGGDARARAREVDLLRFQVAELEGAGVEAADEDERLAIDEDALADATAHREAALVASEALAGEGGAADGLAAAIGALADRPPFTEVTGRLRAALAEVTEAAADGRAAGEAIDDDPEALARVRARRQLLHELQRKYGDSLAEVMAFRDAARTRLQELESHEERAGALEAQRAAIDDEIAAAEAAVGRARRAAAPRLAAAVEAGLRELAMPKARFEVVVGESDPGDGVTFLLSANPGEPSLPLAKVASGGELARTMLALRLVLTEAPDTLVFDEVDAGVGGEAAVAVGRALAELARRHQVLVVTHLPQVAACADTQVVVAKTDDGEVTTARVAVVDGDDRVVELSRMLAGTPESAATREAALDLLATARGRAG
jgi:DNA repair protein RecN (Recombination protein N)